MSERRIICPVCDEIFVDQESLASHQLSHEDFPAATPPPGFPWRGLHIGLFLLMVAGLWFLWARLPREPLHSGSLVCRLESQLEPLLEQPLWMTMCEREQQPRLLVSAPPDLRPLVLERAGSLGLDARAIYFLDPPWQKLPAW